jgi:D-glycero-D-manno-heptose 1,7-bisphosphate phosphatase
MNKAVFFDKDGILNIDKGILRYKEPLEIFPEVGNLIEYLRNKGFLIIVVTNQPIIARGLIDENTLKKKLKKLEDLILKQNNKAIIEKIYYCPHHPNADKEEYRINCGCRKPKPGMLFEAKKEFNIDMKNSYMVGDRISDILAGQLAGCKTVQCFTGKHNEKIIESDLKIKDKIIPDFSIRKISELKEIIK